MSPDIRKHRGAHPEDRKLFAAEQLPRLRAAVNHLSWLLSRDYAIKAAVKVVGDRHALTDRQRLAVSRAGCSDQSKARRGATCLPAESAEGAELIIDGFNLIITVEAALSGGLLMVCRDGCIRDLSSVHGSYRSVDETDGAILLISKAFERLRPELVAWVLDRPVSNSGRLAQRIRDLATDQKWNWSVETVFNPDADIIASRRLVISADAPVLDRVERWINFNRYLIDNALEDSWLIDLSC